jgi:hypothetical protein
VLTCAYCGEQTKLRLPQDSHQAFVRSLVFGVGGAVLGLVLYSAFGIITGLVIGYLSLAVSYIVGKAMMKGSSGVGGRRYQIAALVLRTQRSRCRLSQSVFRNTSINRRRESKEL